MTTRTGSFPIAFRRGWGGWTRDLAALCRWARETGFAAVDLMNLTPADLAIAAAAGVSVGSVDLLDFGKLLADDAGARRDLIQKNAAYIRDLGKAGVKVFFTCVIPGNPSKPRGENYALAVECFAPLCAAADGVGAKIAIEGWPGGSPHLANLCCTPETVRRFIADLKSPSMGVNYDPSHLIRLGVDHIRFLREFVDRVWHVHAKDTELMPEAAYELGLYQGSAFDQGRGFGEHAWRYTVPGHGCARWTEIFRILAENGYRGLVSVELEDENFNGSDEGEKLGLLRSLEFLRGA